MCVCVYARDLGRGGERKGEMGSNGKPNMSRTAAHSAVGRSQVHHFGTLVPPTSFDLSGRHTERGCRIASWMTANKARNLEKD